jgi:hypothetical protein
MARNKLINIHSVATDTAGTGPKLPTKDQIEYGEIAVNYLDGYETISIRNSNDEIITFKPEYIYNALIDNLQKQIDELKGPYEYVDLGLSSGTKWANMNIGATKETDYGLFFQWGDTVGYDESTAAAHSTWSTCPGNGGASSYDTSALSTWDNNNLTNDVLNTSVDAAYVHTNGKAKMPTEAQCKELINETNSEWTSINGVYGRKFTNKTDSSKYIFIPAAGYFSNGSRYSKGSSGYVWSSSLSSISGAFYLYFNSSSVSTGSNGRIGAFSVRGVLA